MKPKLKAVPTPEFQIERGVEIPPKPRSGQKAKYPFEQMEVGDSFFIPGKSVGTIAGTVTHWTKKLGHRYTMRTLTENGVKGVRIWRVE